MPDSESFFGGMPRTWPGTGHSFSPIPSVKAPIPSALPSADAGTSEPPVSAETWNWSHQDAFDAAFWKGKRVFLTGHTGFKGAWLALWLHKMGAQVHGYALDPLPGSFFELVGVDGLLASDTRASLSDFSTLQEAIRQAAPDLVFHLAAQPLVLRSLEDPLETFEANVMGTLRLLEAVKATQSARAVLVITSDKVYENDETGRPYEETDRLGGKDPYSASKACVELVLSSWTRSFAHLAGPMGQVLSLGSARAGNVIGGGDASENRLLPDLVRAFSQGETACVRNPHSVRPWQLVLEPLGGYLLQARALFEGDPRAAGAFNFGPDTTEAVSVGDLALSAQQAWGEEAQLNIGSGEAHSREAKLLQVNSQKAQSTFGWKAVLHPAHAVELTVRWAKLAHDWSTLRPARRARLLEEESLAQIEGFEGLCAAVRGPRVAVKS